MQGFAHNDVIKLKITRVTGPLWVETIGGRLISLTNTNDAMFWCFLWSPSEQTAEQTIEAQGIWDPSRLLWHYCNATKLTYELEIKTWTYGMWGKILLITYVMDAH